MTLLASGRLVRLWWIKPADDYRDDSATTGQTGRENQTPLLAVGISCHCAETCQYGEADGFINYVNGANIAGFRKVAEAMLDQSVV